MALTLDPTLKTRMDGEERQPIAQIISTAFSSSIPFDGNLFGISNSRAFDVDVHALSTGELASISIDSDAIRTIRYMLTDTNRTQWTEYSFQLRSTDCGNQSYVYGTSFCEKPDGNIAIVYRYSYYIRVTTLAKSGTWTANSTQIVSVGSGNTVYNPYIIYNPNSLKYQVFYTIYNATTLTYHLYMVESSDLITWGTPVDISPSNLGTSMKYNNVYARVLSDNDVVVTFDHVTTIEPQSGFETTNIYYMISTDNGSTWGNATAVTSYTGVGKGARHPSIVEKSTGTIYCVFHDRETFVIFDSSADGLICDGYSGFCICAQALHMYNGLLYVTAASTYMGNKYVQGMYIVDPTDMSIFAQYTSTTVPGYNTIFTDHHSFWLRSWDAGPYMHRHISSGGGVTGSDPDNVGVIFVVYNDGVTEWTKTFVMGNGHDLPTYSLNENVSIEGSSHWVSNFNTVFSWIDGDNERLYVYLYDGYLYCRQGCLGWIDLTEVADPGTGYYTWNEIWRKRGVEVSPAYELGNENCMGFTYGRYCKEDDVIVLVQSGSNGCVMVVHAQTGVIQFCGTYASNRNVPYNGLSSAYVYGNKIYGSFTYTDLHDQEEWRGLWIYDMVTDSKVLARPGYATKDQYTFTDYDFSDFSNGHVWIGGNDGAFRFHTGSLWFEPYTDAEIPGFSMGNSTEYCRYIYYDPVNEDVYVSNDVRYLQSWVGVRKFNVNGDYRKGQYQQGLKLLTDLGLTNQQDLTYGNFELEIIAVVDEEDVLWALWDHIDNVDDDRDFMWDSDESETDVSDDLTDVVEISWDIEVPSELRFSLANGYKYDQQNLLSTLAHLFKRGRKVVPKFGENINGTEYWVQQGIFIVEEASMSYDRANHPILEIVARDISSLWQDARVVLTDFYDAQGPEYVLNEILSDWTVLDSSEYDIPTIETTHTIWNQWQDETLYDIIKSILDHFEYVFHFDTNGVFAPIRLEFDKAVDHTYSDQLQIRNYSPDTSFSSFVNQLRVIGETHDYLEIVYDPEEVGQVNGTCGWWDETIEHTVWYNQEHTRKIRNPYLVVNISTGDFSWFLAKFGGTEYISYEDPEELYCIITVEGPNLIPVVVGLAAILLALGAAAVGCDGFFTGVCGFYINACMVNVNLLCMALLANATYDFTVWGMPLGKQKQTIQYLATDQSQMNVVNQQPVIEEIEDPLCYEVAQCQRVAEFELNILKYQRERIRLDKIAHLQDEIHDMLIVYHPYSGQPMQILVANLRRTLVIRGEMIDSIEGWRIA